MGDVHVHQGRPAEQLLARRNADGGWGATDGAVSNSECTALACLALAATDEGAVGPALAEARQWLLRRQHESGAWSYSAETPLAPWPTPIVLLALGEAAEAGEARDRGFRWLLATRGANFGWLARLRQFLSGERVVELDDRLEGWPWAPETFSWVEPTSWALVALKSRWPYDRPRAVRARIGDGEEMLLDRACVGGGWNYGNKRVLGEELPPYPDTTALALMALRGRDAPAVGEGFAALDALLGEHASVLSLSLAVLSHRAWGRNADELRARLAGRLDRADRVDGRSLALAAMASAPQLAWLEDGAHA